MSQRHEIYEVEARLLAGGYQEDGGKAVASGKIQPDEDVVAILTGHALKDPDYTVNYHGGSLGYTDVSGARVEIVSRYASRLLQVPAERGAILSALAL